MPEAVDGMEAVTYIMSLFEEAMADMRSGIVAELEQRLLDRLEPIIRQELLARHMSVLDTANYLHVSDQTIRRLIRDGDLPSFRVRGQIFVRQMDVDTWIESQIKT